MCESIVEFVLNFAEENKTYVWLYPKWQIRNLFFWALRSYFLNKRHPNFQFLRRTGIFLVTNLYLRKTFFPTRYEL